MDFSSSQAVKALQSGVLKEVGMPLCHCYKYNVCLLIRTYGKSEKFILTVDIGTYSS